MTPRERAQHRSGWRCREKSWRRGMVLLAMMTAVGCARRDGIDGGTAGGIGAVSWAERWVLAHRGASGYRPEHSRAAYELAIAQGADFIEPDVVPTRDGVLIVRHEGELSLTTDVAARFPDRRREKQIDGRLQVGWFSEDFTLAEIKSLRVRQAMPTLRDTSFDGQFEVLTLAEVMSLAIAHSERQGRPVGLYIETKHPTYFASIGLPLQDRLLQALADHGLPRAGVPVVIQSFEPTILRWLHARTTLPLVLLIDSEGAPYDGVAAGDPRSYRDWITPAALREVAAFARGIGPHKGWIVPAGAGTSAVTSLIADAHAAGLWVHPWTFRREAKFVSAQYAGDVVAEMAHFFQLGADGLFTDFPDLGVRARAQASGIAAANSPQGSWQNVR